MIQLPQSYKERMTAMLGEQANEFLAAYNEPRTFGLRLNPLKCPSRDSERVESLRRLFNLMPVPWCSTGYYYPESIRPGKHPYYSAGVYYIQEPSAMSAAELLAPQPGDLVLDLAAAPGGKSTQIAGMLRGQGLLVANEIHPARAKILSENIERMGVTNAIVTSAAPDELAAKFPASFDRIMLDAPCSGEGMFRKDPEAIAEWSPDHVAMCASRQMDILRQAAIMLKPGGTLAYSTCTFNAEENELTIAAFVSEHRDFTVVQQERLWPHLVRGEGHFVAVLRKNESAETAETAETADGSKSGKDKRGKSKGRERRRPDQRAAEALSGFAGFMRTLAADYELPEGEPILFGDKLYLLPDAFSSGSSSFHADALHGLKVLRPGLHLATLKKNRFEPAHSLAVAAAGALGCASSQLPLLSFAADSPEIAAYLSGQAIQLEADVQGWMIVAVDGYPLGWAKASGGQLKNHLPKGLRKL